MPSSNSAAQRVRQDARKRVISRARKRALWTTEKRFRGLIEAGDYAAAEEAMREAISLYDKAAKTNLVHKNKADRKKSQLQRALRDAQAEA